MDIVVLIAGLVYFTISVCVISIAFIEFEEHNIIILLAYGIGWPLLLARKLWQDSGELADRLHLPRRKRKELPPKSEYKTGDWR